jgi:hypothetical protein
MTADQKCDNRILNKNPTNGNKSTIQVEDQSFLVDSVGPQRSRMRNQ